MHSEDLIKEIGKSVADITAEKNKAYGSSFENTGKILQILYPNGVSPDQYTDMLLLTRMLDKFFRIANDKGAFNEDPYMDLAGYGLLGALNNKNNKKRG
jgi:hypothetical protein